MTTLTRLLPLLMLISTTSCAQTQLKYTDPQSGLKLIVVNKEFPLVKILLPGQPESDRGIEVEFPEHVTGFDVKTGALEHIYLASRGDQNIRSIPKWRIENNSIIYETVFNNSITMIASAKLETDGIAWSYKLTNNSVKSYMKLQAVTCVKLYSGFSDTLMKRTYVHHPEGFDLLASETPKLAMPCRYLVSYKWAVPKNLVEIRDDGITYYNKSRKVDKPFIATWSHDKKWIAATCTRETGNLWSNPERSCQHADPYADLVNTAELKLKTFIIKGTMDDILNSVNSYIKK